MDISRLEGIVAILPTPLAPNGAIDEPALRHLVEFGVEQGMDGLVVLGSNGEFPYLSFEEKREVMGIAAETAAGRIPVIGTASAAGTDQAVALARAADDAGCDAVMAAVPAYFEIGADEVVSHMETLASEGDVPVFFYHFPEVTGVELSPAEIAQVAAVPGVVGAKITVVNSTFQREVIEATRPSDWQVFSGTSFLLASCVEAGGAGVCCPLPLLGPAAVRELWVALRDGRRQRAEALQADLLRAIPLMSGIDAPVEQLIDGFKLAAHGPFGGSGTRPAPSQGLLKAALRLCGHPLGPTVKSPCREAGEEEVALLERTLHELGWVNGS
ncbi:MAG: 4-hydroxy-tetrahydrodipicolinate synthase [Acidimicrobiales bacterium]|nr:4-hydroxy-tetrahydrodipicolinate synthase [Acidimicrobiales bacterium]